MSKTCKTCNEEKPLDLFSKEKRNTDGHTSKCTKCLSIYIKNYYLNNKENIKKKSNIYYAKNTEKCKEANKLNYQKNKTRYIEMNKKWQENNLEKVKGYRKAKNINRLGKYKDIQKLWVINNIEAVKEHRKTWKKFISENLTDSYVRGMLQKRTQMSGGDLPQELVEVKRVQILINREIRNKNVINNY
jgi:hypothetical protein